MQQTRKTVSKSNVNQFVLQQSSPTKQTNSFLYTIHVLSFQRLVETIIEILVMQESRVNASENIILSLLPAFMTSFITPFTKNGGLVVNFMLVISAMYTCSFFFGTTQDFVTVKNTFRLENLIHYGLTAQSILCQYS